MQEIEKYISPRTLEEAVQAMADGDVTILCGGTDLTVQTAADRIQYSRVLMNINRIEGLSGINLTEDKIRVGALTTVTEIMENTLINELAPVLVEAADQFACDQLRNAASVGGNICNASPAGDMIIPFMVLDASVELASWSEGAIQTRLVPLDEFFTGPGTTVKHDNELLTAIIFEKPVDNFIAHFKKSGPRPALEIATVSIGIGGSLENGSFNNVRVAMGAVAPMPLRARKLEATLAGKPLDAARIQAVADSAGKDAAPIDDIRGSAWYRNHLICVFTHEVLSHVAENRN